MNAYRIGLIALLVMDIPCRTAITTFHFLTGSQLYTQSASTACITDRVRLGAQQTTKTSQIAMSMRTTNIRARASELDFFFSLLQIYKYTMKRTSEQETISKARTPALVRQLGRAPDAEHERPRCARVGVADDDRRGQKHDQCQVQIDVERPVGIVRVQVVALQLAPAKFLFLNKTMIKAF